MPVTSFSRTPADNNAAPPNGWPEGMAPSAVNNTARQLMTDIVNEAAKGQARVLASVAGTNTITATMTPDLDAYAGAAGMIIVFTPAGANTGATTLNIDALGALDVFKYDGEALSANDLITTVPAVLVLDAGADDWILLNPQSQITTSPNTDAQEFGFKGLPQNSITAPYTAILADAARMIYGGGGGTVTIPANSSVAFPVGSVLTFVNPQGSGSSTIAITTDSLRLAGTTTTGSRTLAENGIATAVKITSTTWIISGTGLS